MKRKVLSVLMALALIFPLATPAFAIDVVVNNQKLELDQEPVIEDGRTLIPMRAIFEALGANVTYDADFRRVLGAHYDKDIFLLLFIDKKDYLVLPAKDFNQALADGVFEQTNTLAILGTYLQTGDVAPKILNERTMVPLRLVGETLGATVIWNEADSTVYVDSELPQATNTFQEATVTKNIDGTTIEADINGVNHTVKIIGLVTPESHEGTAFFSAEASAYAESLIPVGSVVYLQKDISEMGNDG